MENGENGDKLFASAHSGGRSNSSAQANLNYYQALLLLGIPEDEREIFILQHNVQNMTTQELDQALKDWNKTAKPRSELTTVASQASTKEYEERCGACCKTIADTFFELLTALR